MCFHVVYMLSRVSPCFHMASSRLFPRWARPWRKDYFLGEETAPRGMRTTREIHGKPGKSVDAPGKSDDQPGKDQGAPGKCLGEKEGVPAVLASTREVRGNIPPTWPAPGKSTEIQGDRGKGFKDQEHAYENPGKFRGNQHLPKSKISRTILRYYSYSQL